MLEKSTEIIQSNCCPTTTMAINLCPSKEKEVRKKIMDFSDNRRNSSDEEAVKLIVRNNGKIL